MKISGKLLIQLLFLVSSLNFLQSQEPWIHIQSPTTKWLYRCTFTDTLNGWAAGDSGIVIHTSDGGNSWVEQYTGMNNFIEDIFFLNPRLGWGISNDYLNYGTIILRTTNGGNNWSVSRYPDTTIIINTVYYLDSLNGYFGGMGGIILKTTNAGSDWIKGNMGTSFFSVFPVRKINFLNPQYGLACGGIMDVSGTLWRTTDYGYNWDMMDTTPEPVNDVLYYNSQFSFAAGGDFEYGGSFLRSSNNGLTWIDTTVGIFGAGQSVALRTLHEIWVPLAFSQLWMVTIDTGKTWISVTAPDTSAIYDALFLNPSKGWACGANGGVFKFNPNYFIIGVNNNNIPVAAYLSQNYPNPFNPATTIDYEVLLASKVKITLFDIIGREVKILLNDYKMPGKYSFKVTSDGLSSGVYFYKMETGSYSLTKKMVLIK